MKKEIKGFMCGVIATSLIGCVSISATGVWDKIDVLRNDINVVVNGTPVNADNFLYNDTTYLPMRIVAEALGKDVQYDETTNTATIKDKGDNNLSETKPVDLNNNNKYTPPPEITNDNSAYSRGMYEGKYTVGGRGIEYILNLSAQKYGSDKIDLDISMPDFVFYKNGAEVYRCAMYECPFGVYYDTLIDEILPALGIDNTPYL